MAPDFETEMLLEQMEGISDEALMKLPIPGETPEEKRTRFFKAIENPNFVKYADFI